MIDDPYWVKHKQTFVNLANADEISRSFTEKGGLKLFVRHGIYVYTIDDLEAIEAVETWLAARVIGPPPAKQW